MLLSDGCATMYGGGFSDMVLYSRVSCDRCQRLLESQSASLRTRLFAARVAIFGSNPGIDWERVAIERRELCDRYIYSVDALRPIS